MYPRLLGDVGGTHTRLGWQDRAGQPLTLVARLRNDAHPDLAQAIEAYLHERRLPRPAAACLGLATPVSGDQVTLTNRGWSFSIDAMARRLGLRRLKVINDFTALALALPGLEPAERQQVGGSLHLPGRWPLALLGPGTGLGMGGLLPAADGRWLALAGEGGHATLAAHTDLEWRLIQRLREGGGHVSAERVLSGAGLGRLHQALRQECGRAQGEAPWPPERIVDMGLRGGDASCLQTLELFAGFLGSVAGDLALTLGARGGVYLGGGMLPHLQGWFARSSFRARFEAKGRFEHYLRDIPVWVIDDRQAPALRGAALALDQEEFT